MRSRVWIIALIAVVVIGSAFGSLALLGGGTGGGIGSSHNRFSANQIGIIYVTGVISAGSSGSSPLGGGAVAGSDELMAQIQDAADDPAIKAVVLRVNSPGGVAAASQEIASEIQKLRKSGKKVVVSMADVAASGAYWISAGTDYIMANPATETGSIGVIMELINYEGLYGKLGLQSEVIKSAEHKDIGSPTRPMTESERAILQGMVNDIFEQFVQVVAEGRKLPPDKVRELADGRVFTGRQAQQFGLVDGLGNFHDAIDKAAELADIEDNYEVVDMQPESSFSQFLRGLGLRGNTPSLGGWLQPLQVNPDNSGALLRSLQEGGLTK